MLKTAGKGVTIAAKEAPKAIKNIEKAGSEAVSKADDGIKAAKKAVVKKGEKIKDATVKGGKKIEKAVKENVSEAKRAAGTVHKGGSKTVDVKLSKKKYPESAQHIEEAIKEGQPDTLTIDRSGASARRRASLQGVDTVPEFDRDEYPPAMSKEGGAGASVKLINPSDNRGSGSSISGQLRKYPNGTKYRIIIIDEV
ncbi:NucA/NucB deoxyribonuclease domain-containing protein [[Clostridium] polysaccharolyticum]|uniref:Deoxyribonuclease NucA/NucB n=1 Tax=[Clostridium] polysaccharolyticum TaxID=29364 RepID=A0A1I0CD18_9FIRM|nr:NucA/NucB deoxyribonuclease domain-containing protein [[Clostridium] polysaccharolyticum]SET16810.1 Deoxyribonuclease NucA/NucB [[Clostridium] polysaccharolyticum]